MHALVPRRPRVFYGWYIIGACGLIHLYLGAFFHLGFTNIFDPMRHELGWSATATALAFSFQRLEGGIASPFVGVFLDRYGPRKLMVTGMLVVGLALVLMSRMQTLWHFYTLFLLASLAVSMGSGIAFNAAAVKWFVKKRTQAISIMWSGIGLSALLIPLFVLLIDHVGWRTTLFLVGVGTWLLLVPAAALVRARPEPYGYLPDGAALPDSGTASERQAALDASARVAAVGLSARQALRTPAFWLVSLAFGLFNMSMSAIMVFLVPHLTSETVGFSPRAAGLTLSLYIAVVTPARLAMGYVGDRIESKKWIVIGVFLLQALAMLILALMHSYAMAIAFGVVLGVAQGVGNPVRPVFFAELFGTRAFSTIQGFSQSLSVAGGIVGPVMGGLVFDRVGTYSPAILVMALAIVIAVPLLLAVRRPRPPVDEPVPSVASTEAS